MARVAAAAAAVVEGGFQRDGIARIRVARLKEDSMLRRIKSIHLCFALVALPLMASSTGMVPAAAASEPGRSTGQTVYVPVYSHIFFGDRGATFNLATTLSIRNVDPGQAVSVLTADYYDGSGRLLRRHFNQPVVLKPLASTEIFIPESDVSGGFGASFLVRWKSEKPTVPPIIECLMIGARSGQGISFVSPGRVVQETP
jgi:hypothetical protein